jgi:isoleucyl-tRNA synthetase
MNKLKNVDSKFDFVAMEQKTLDFWKTNEIVEKYMKKNVGSKQKFSFFDGPITANNQMGLHHAWGRAYKDFVARYKTMKGFEQRYQMGFDCQGLWVEVEVEKDLGFNSKKDIFEFGMDKFTLACKERVNKFTKIQTSQSERLGMFMDWKNSYYTNSENNNLYLWKFLKKCKEDGLLYKNHSATTWCPRCETGLSQHEQADGYMDVTDTSVYVKFPIKGRKNEYILAWTTTPWTLAANVLVAVNSAFDYVKVKDEKDTMYLGAKSAKTLGFKDTTPVDISEILKMEYESLYDIPAQKGVRHYVVEWNLVTEDTGSGIVHIAPGCGQEDYELGLKVGAPALSPLNEQGRYMEGWGSLTGKYAHDVKEEVLAYLKEQGVLFKTEEYTHSYPHCWRCKTKCLFRLEYNWFINISKIREQLKEQAKSATWYPDYTLKRMEDWLKNMGDWMISRKRVYGLALPFYECECGEVTVVGGLEELKELAVDPKKVDKLESIHRPWIDAVEIKCPKCGNEVKRIVDVGDCWLDAGIVPFSTLKYFEDKKYWEKWFPADFITESIEQVRLWYYSMLVFGVIFEGKIPYKEIFSYAEMRDEKNEKMSKTKKNFIPFDEAANKAGSDIIRWTFTKAPLGRNIIFGWTPMEATKRQFILPFWNTYTYFVMYANSNNWNLDEKFDATKLTNPLDRWVVSSLHKLEKEVNEAFDKYKFQVVSEKIENFVVDLSTWYIRRNRDRFKQGDKDALSTLYYVLLDLTKLMAPIMPFMTEEIYQNLVVNLGVKGAPQSIHLCEYPEGKPFDEEILANMQLVKDAATLGLNIRDTQKIKLRQPLSVAYVNLSALELVDILKEELNVKDVKVTTKPEKGEGLITMQNNGIFVTLDTNISEELKAEGLLRDLTRQIQDYRKKCCLKVGDNITLKIYSKDKEVKMVVEKFKDTLSKSINAKDILFEENKGEEVKIGEISVRLEVVK